ncbi:MAG TPA: Holliday junction resolvase RuvX [Patescibacteria group bacterium]|nr:Holliday junction resolvase RuvX [Patescibacteria group bacterium]
MRYLGIDFGLKRTGVAVSDADGRIAVIKETIDVVGQQQIIDRIKAILEEEKNIDAIVIGMPLNMKGEGTEMTSEVERFVAKLRNHVSVPVQTYDERLTTEMAHTLLRGVTQEKRDQVAAQIILQNFLDGLANKV